MVTIQMSLKIHCCTYSLLSGFSQAQHITTQTCYGGEKPAYTLERADTLHP